MATDIANLRVRIGADNSELNEKLTESRGMLGGFSRQAKIAAAGVAAVGAAALAAATGVARFAYQGGQAIDAATKLARQLDATQGGLRGLELAASDAGVSTGALTGAAERLNVTLGEARRGVDRASSAFERLGLNVDDLAAMDIDERFATIADRMHAMGLSSDQAADALRQMGIRQGEVINLMRQGGDAIRDARQEIDSYSLALSVVDTAAIEYANDQIARLGLITESAQTQLAAGLVPAFGALAQMINEAARESDLLGGKILDFSRNAARWLAIPLDGFHELRLANARLGLAIQEAGLAVVTFAHQSLQSIQNLVQGVYDSIRRMADAIPGISVEQLGSREWEMVERLGSAWDSVHQSVMRGREEMERLRGINLGQQYLDTLDSILGQGAGDGGGGGLGGLDLGGGGAGGGSSEQERQEQEIEQRREYFEQRLEALRQGLMNERELEIEHHRLRMEELAEIRDHEVISDEEYRKLKEESELQHLERLRNMEARAADERVRIQQQEAQARQQVVNGMMNNLVSLMNSGSREMFNIGKVAAVAQALLAGREAIVSSYAAGARIGGPPLGAAYAATAAAATAAQIASVKSTSFGGGGGSTTTGGGSSRPTDNLAQRPADPGGGREFAGTLTLQGISPGSLFSGDMVQELIEELREAQRRGYEIVVQQ